MLKYKVASHYNHREECSLSLDAEGAYNTDVSGSSSLQPLRTMLILKGCMESV